MEAPQRHAENLGWLDATGLVRASGWLVWSLCALCAAALAACWIVQMDVVVQASATLVPRDEALPVQAQRAGWVARALVEPGQAVVAGQVLLELDRADLETTARSLRERIATLDARIEALLRLKESRHALGESEQQETRAALAKAHAVSREAQLDLRRLGSELKVATHQAERRQSLLQRGLVGAEEAEEADLGVDRLRLLEAGATQRARGQHAEAARVRRSLRSEALSALVRGVELDVEVAALAEQRAQLVEQAEHTSLLDERSSIRAPRSGTVLDLRVRGAGVRVDAGETLAWVAPAQTQLVAEVLLPPRGAGLVRTGHWAHLKLDAYPFQDFGVLSGRLEWVAADVSREHESDERGSYRKARLLLRDSLRDDSGKALPLKAGMHGSAEVVLHRVSVAAALLHTFRGVGGSVTR